MQRVLTYLADQGISLLEGMRRGIEKENLRVDNQGHMLYDRHPCSLGASLTHPYITTDFSENLVEMITTPCHSVDRVLHELTQINGFVLANIGKQYLWPYSMPPHIIDPEMIRIAEYGTSNSARMRRIYRIGLAHRYGKLMQVIAGIHYNISVSPQLIEALNASTFDYDYMSLTRQFLRHYALLIYLFGASPACDNTFITGTVPDFLHQDDKDTYIGKYATSLRMSSLGYHNPAQATVPIRYDSIKHYVQSLLQATRTPYPDYEAIGVKTEEGYRQLNGNVMQIENEYYSPIRPKQPAQHCERPASALSKRGVAYIEMRCVDLNPLEPLGLNTQQLQFYDLFILWCLLQDSSVIRDQESVQLHNIVEVVSVRGRDPSLKIVIDDQAMQFRDWVKSVLSTMYPLAEYLDAHGGQGYMQCVQRQFAKVEDATLTPSAQVLAEMVAGNHSIQSYATLVAVQQSEWLRKQPIDAYLQQQLLTAVKQSVTDRKALEAKGGSFVDYLNCYFAGDCLC